MADRWDNRNRSEYRGGYERGIDRDRERDFERNRDRGFVDRAGDEVRSWFGDEDAARRRRLDEREEERQDRGPTRDREYGTYGTYGYGRDRDWMDRTRNAGERTWDRTREEVRDWTQRDRDRDWPGRGDYDTGERSFGDTSRYASAGTPGYRRWAGTEYGREQGWSGTSYRGRGPRNYQRSDERIREDVCDRLTDDPRIDASDIDVQVRNGEVTLSGNVRSRDEKRFAEDLAEDIGGVRDVNNSLRVNREDVIGTARSGASTLGLSQAPAPGSTAPNVTTTERKR